MTTKDFQKLHDEIIALREKGQFDKAMEFFTDDCCIMTPMHDPMNKKQAIEFHTKNAKTPEAQGKRNSHCESVTLSGDLAIEHGKSTFTLPTGDKHGYYLCVWRNEGGKWKIFNFCVGAKREG